jgi:hypothetical protein
MEMVKVGGSLLLFTPSNNQLGHGFYQFSPELFYNILSESNGFQVNNMVAIELSPAHRHYKVSNPSDIRARVTLTNSWPVILFVQAERVKKVPLFTQTPQQTDYQAAWKDKGEESLTRQTQVRAQSSDYKISMKAKLRDKLVATAPSLIAFMTTFRQVFLNRQSGFKNSRFFKERSS